METDSTGPYLWMLTGCFAFAWMGATTHFLGASCDWRILALVRALAPMLCMAVLALSAGIRFPLGPGLLWVRSVSGSLGMLCMFYALTHLPTHVVLAITNTFPIWVTLLSWPALGQRPHRSVWLAVVVSIIGVLLIQNPFAHGFTHIENFAPLIAVCNSLITAVALISLHTLRKVDPRAVILHFSSVAVVLCLALFTGGTAGVKVEVFDGLRALMLVGIGLCATFGQFCLTKAFTTGTPARVAVVALTQVVFAWIFDLGLGERSFDVTTLLGVLLVVLPTGWVLLLRRSRQPRIEVPEEPRPLGTPPTSPQGVAQATPVGHTRT